MKNETAARAGKDNKKSSGSEADDKIVNSNDRNVYCTTSKLTASNSVSERSYMHIYFLHFLRWIVRINDDEMNWASAKNNQIEQKTISIKSKEEINDLDIYEQKKILHF